MRLPYLFCSLVLMCGLTMASEPVKKPDKTYSFSYDQHGGGFYNYEAQPPEEPEEELAIKPLDYKTIWEMHPDEFKVLLEEKNKKALQTLKEEDVLQYLELQDIAIQKASAYASVGTYVAQQNPRLSSNADYPINAPGQRALHQVRESEINDLIAKSINDFALIMFTQEGCSYCTAQEDIIVFFENKFGWEIRRIDFLRDKDIAAQFNVEITPSILIVARESGKAMYVSTGVVTMEELRTNVYRAIRVLNGSANPEEWLSYEFKKNKRPDFSKKSQIMPEPLKTRTQPPAKRPDNEEG